MSLENMLSSEDTFGGKQNKPVLVIGKIYADWCGHCVALKPEWAKLKRDVKAAMGRYFKNVRVEFHEIGDTPHNKSRGLTVDGMLEKFNGKHMLNSPEKLALDGGYPTLFKLHKGKLEYYKGSRDAKSMFQWYTQGLSGNRKMLGGASSKKRSFRRKPNRKTLYDYIFGRSKTQRRKKCLSV
jgi:thiol-disulfide isomerase/thioredoxin